MERAHNFNAGPSALPLEVLQKAQEELVNFKNTGMSVMELSHRSKEYSAVHDEAKQLLKEIMEVPDTHDILFIQGGASLQFSMVPMNFLGENEVADYVLTGSWSDKALKEAKKHGQTNIAASSKDDKYKFIPSTDDIKVSENSSYLHITSNNTIYGTQWKNFPTNQNVIADMSSDILSRKVSVKDFSLIYAGAQKNLGPSGVTVVILKKELLAKIPENLPTMLDYNTYINSNSLYNTPPTFAIYMLSLVLNWVKNNGGIEKIEAINNEKAGMLYHAIEQSDGFYSPHAREDSRSHMNVTFTLPNEELTKKFLAESKEVGFVGLNGHRSVGGCRASIYNAVPLSSCEALRDFMVNFKKNN